MVNIEQYVDHMNYGPSLEIIRNADPYRMDPATTKELRFQAIKAAFTHHYENNKVYRGFCEIYNVTPDDLRTPDDIVKIPLVPSDFFKEISAKGQDEYVTAIASVPAEQIARKFTTSGTRGKPSIYPYDGRTLQVVNESNTVIFKSMGGINPEDYVLFLTPSFERSDTGMVQGMYMTLRGLLSDPDSQIQFAITDTTLDAEIVRELLLAQDGRTRHLYGPPYAYIEVADALIASGMTLQLDEGSKAITTGGWKKYKGDAISADELRQKITEAFGIQKGSIRDGLGLTDIMSILLECEEGHKHVPPWMDVSIRDLNDSTWTKTVPVGEEGLIAFIDPLLGSYPLGIVTGDAGRLVIASDEMCSCGRYGPVIEYVKRVGDPRGCAIRQQQMLDEAKKVVNPEEDNIVEETAEQAEGE